MEIYRIASTENTPSVTLNHNENLIEFSGESRPEDVQQFYHPIIKWLNNYEMNLFYIKDKTGENITTTCNFKFEYFNSSSAKYIMDIILKLEEIKSKYGVIINLNWYYDEEDEDMKDSGYEFEKMLGIEFNYFPIID
ncbi:MAG: DUF1987 domain-containing protein [Flavobacteriales bacterium]|nr:DUF1987 domain-containing protein [Flavobacteriales bacterium]